MRLGDAGAARSADSARARSLGHRVGGYSVGPATVQRYSFEDFDSYEDAKDATIYGEELLDEQKDDPIDDHFQKGFDSDQQDEIYRVNKAHHGEGKIVADDDGATFLFKQNTSRTPHVDHRFPKSKGGSNSFANAAVLSARQNISKSNKLELDAEPKTPLAPYKEIHKLSFAYFPVGGKEFSSEQRRMILDANEQHYGKGDPVSDADGKTKLTERYDSTRVPHVDHITPKSEGGTNYYFNAQVLPANRNIQKGGRKGVNPDLDWAVGEMSLVEYYDKKEKGEVTNYAISML